MLILTAGCKNLSFFSFINQALNGDCMLRLKNFLRIYGLKSLN